MTTAHRPSDDHRIDSLHHLREIIPILTQHVSPLAFISSHKKDPAALAQKISHPAAEGYHYSLYHASSHVDLSTMNTEMTHHVLRHGVSQHRRSSVWFTH